MAAPYVLEARKQSAISRITGTLEALAQEVGVEPAQKGFVPHPSVAQLHALESIADLAEKVAQAVEQRARARKKSE